MTDWVIGVDVGGTFTDFSARNKNDHHIQVHKRPSTPDDPSRAILEGLQELLNIADIDGAKQALSNFSIKTHHRKNYYSIQSVEHNKK